MGCVHLLDIAGHCHLHFLFHNDFHAVLEFYYNHHYNLAPQRHGIIKRNIVPSNETVNYLESIVHAVSKKC